MPTLNWIGKEAVVNQQQQVPFRLLNDVPDLACGDSGRGNLFVQGDNLVALMALLPLHRRPRRRTHHRQRQRLAPSQPRATPWETIPEANEGLKARPMMTTLVQSKSKHHLPVTALILFAAFTCWTASTMAGEPLRLSIWPGEAPLGDGKTEKVEVPITVHLPKPGLATGAAMVICPGGGYGGRVVEGEGHGIARWLNAHGIAGVVLEYRLPGGNYHRPMLDAQRALRVVRSHAAEWKLDPRRIGIIGFSAGGHLASTVGTHFDAGNERSADPVERLSCRPDFMVLVYPVITMGEKTHGGSRNNLLGPSPSAKLVELLSNEKQVTDKTPPAFLTHARTDAVVPVAHSQMFYEALKAHGVPAELQEFPQGNHGYNGYRGEEWDAWQKRSLEWLRERGLLKSSQ